MAKKRTAEIRLKTPDQVACMREAGRIVADVLLAMRDYVRPGVSTLELDALAEAMIRKQGAVPAFKGYLGFPATLCTSVNDELVHGIPSAQRRLNMGDVISIDVGAIVEGWHGDSAYTYAVGPVSPDVQHLLQVTEGSLYAGIAAAKAGDWLSQVSAAIENHVVANGGLAIVREYGGHGIGQALWEPPHILNYVPSANGRGHADVRLEPGMTLALEPMLQLGTWQTRVLDDGWTVVSTDGSWSAHFEHTILITDGEPEILTRGA